MRKPVLLLTAICLFALTAFAEEWTKTYQVGDKPSLRVDTNDAGVDITRGASRTISARVISEGYKQGDLHVTERQDGDHVELNVHLPNEWGVHFGTRYRKVRIEVQVPQDTALDLHSGDGHINVNGISGTAKIDTGDGAVEVRDFNGSLDAHTSDGHITADGVFTNVELRTGDGHVDFTARPGSRMAGDWLIRTGDGRVEVRLPQEFAAELYAHTGDGRITVDFPITVSGSLERSRIRTKINGGGPLLEIVTGDGGVRIGKL